MYHDSDSATMHHNPFDDSSLSELSTVVDRSNTPFVAFRVTGSNIQSLFQLPLNSSISESTKKVNSLESTSKMNSFDTLDDLDSLSISNDSFSLNSSTLGKVGMDEYSQRSYGNFSRTFTEESLAYGASSSPGSYSFYSQGQGMLKQARITKSKQKRHAGGVFRLEPVPTSSISITHAVRANNHMAERSSSHHKDALVGSLSDGSIKKSKNSLNCKLYSNNDFSSSQSTPKTLKPGIESKSNRDSKDEFKSDIQNILKDLDPLSLNANLGLQYVFDNMNGKEYEEASDATDDELTEVYDIEDIADSPNRTFETQRNVVTVSDGSRRLSLDTDRLAEVSFMKRILVENVTISDAHNLVMKMHDIFQVIDDGMTGLITWNCFSQVILSIVPQQLLRSDVVSFLNAQTEEESALVDYNQFTTSGKVLVIDQTAEKSKLLISGWLHRQDANETVNNTWEKHVKWFNKRYSRAVVWLMRKARKALGMSAVFADTSKMLFLYGRQARVITYFLNLADLVKCSGDVHNLLLTLYLYLISFLTPNGRD